MKRTLVVLAALLLSFLMADARTVKKSYEIDDFNGIKATSAFEVIVEHSEEYKVEIEISEEFLPFLLVKNRGGVLELNFTRLPFRLKQMNRNKIVRATIALPELTYIELSGASQLSSNDQFNCTMNRFTVDLKGGSEITNLNVKSPEMDIRLAGASKALMSVRCSDISAELGGASRLEISGETVDLNLKVTGASRVRASELDAEDVDVVAKGASSVDVRVSEALTVDLAGASKCKYYGGDENLKLRADNIKGASSLKHED